MKIIYPTRNLIDKSDSLVAVMIFFFMIIYTEYPGCTGMCGSRIFSGKGEGVVRKKTVFVG